MGLGLSGTCRFGRSGTRDSDYRERLIATKPRKSAWNHPPSNYANRKESFGFLLTHSDAGNRTCAGRRIARWSDKPLGFLIFRSPELSAWPLEAAWLAASAAPGEAVSTQSQRLFGGEIDAEVTARADPRGATHTGRASSREAGGKQG